MKRIYLALFLLLTLYAKVFSQNNLPPAYEIKTDTAYIHIPDSCWQMLEDAEGKATIDNVSQSPLSQKFHANTDIAKSTINTYWARFRLKDSMDHEARVYFPCGVSMVDLYTK